MAGAILCGSALAVASGGETVSTPSAWASENPRVYDRFGPYLWYPSSPSVAERPGIQLDAQGLPLNSYGGAPFYNPVSISQYGLHHHGRWLRRHRADDRAKAIRAADWLLANQRGDGRWLYDFTYTVGKMGPSPGVTLSAPWSSAMAQGQAMSLLVRSWRLTGDRDHLHAAQRAVGPLRADVSKGGLQRRLAGGPFFEEYPTTPPSHVLNGFLFTVIGLWDVSPWSPEAAELYRASRGTARRALRLYDRGARRPSAYHLGHLTAGQPVHANPVYHDVHRAELRALNAIDRDRTFARFIRRWRKLT